MSILSKKINLESAAPSHILNGSHRWRPLHVSVCELISKMVGRELMLDGLDYQLGSLKPLMKDLGEPGFYFGYAVKEDPVSVLLDLDVKLAPHVTARSLGSAAHTDIGLLDMLLLRPVAKTVLDGLSDLLGSHDGPNLDLTSQNQSPQAFIMPKDNQMWALVTLYIKPAEDDDAAAKPVGKTSSRKKEMKSKQKSNKNDARFSLRLLMPQSVLEKACLNENGCTAQPVIDASNPWIQHMRLALDEATVPVRAVVETCRMTVAECTRLEINQVIELPGVSLQAIALETELGEGTLSFATGALGVYKAQRAMKLINDIDVNFIPDTRLI